MKAPSEEITANQRKEHNVKVQYIQWVSTLSLTIYGSVFIRLCVVASKITRNSPKIRSYSSSKSFKVIDLVVNRKLICNFLLVINSNYGRISYHFRDTGTFTCSS